MEEKPKILVVGSLVMERIAIMETVSCEDQTVLGKNFHKVLVGKSVNQAVQAARLGAEVTIVGIIGSDENGEEIRKVCKELGVNVAHIIYENMLITEEDVFFLKEKIREYDVVILQNKNPPQLNLIVARYAYESEVPVMLSSAPSTKHLDELYGYLTYISLCETEIENMTGINIEHEGINVNLHSVQDAAEAVRTKGVKNVLVTLGSAGSFLVHEEGGLYIPAVTDIKVVDPTAAGDSFVGAFCVGVCLGWKWENVLIFANYTAGITVSKMGALTSLPTLEMVKQESIKRKVDYNL